MKRQQLLQIYQRLVDCYGPQHWWPADSAFEVMVGAILTQNTAWTNVERAISDLKKHKKLSPQSILGLKEDRLAGLIRPSGYFNIKARRLKNYCRWYEDSGGFHELNGLGTPTLRNELLKVNGVGPETADDILLYAFERPVFVIDAYTRRLFSRLGLIKGDETYETLRHRFESNLDTDVTLFNEYHALIVRHAKEGCTGEEACRHCYVETGSDRRD
jgi:endonuclease-3 related protein